MNELRCKVLVIGGGPGGYVAAIRAGQLGLDTILVEGGRLGGTCLNVGCIPSKALIHAAGAAHGLIDPRALNAIGLSVGAPKLDFARTIAWKDSIVARLTSGVGALLKKAKVRTLLGAATIVDGKTATVSADTGESRIQCEHLVLATGSEPVELQALEFGDDILSSTDALALTEVPQSLAVVGAGYIGMELGMAFAKLGAKVTIVEALPKILPLYDAELTQPVVRRLADLGVETLVGAKAIAHANGALKVVGGDGKERAIDACKVLVAVGRRARVGGFGLETLDLKMSGPFVRIDATCATSMRNVWAIGDVTGEPMLAHRAMAQGAMVAEIIAGRKRAFDHVAIPAICFTDPEIVAVGLSPDAARAAHGEIRVGHFPFRANGRAMTLQDDEGFVRIVARADNHVVLGIHAVGAGVSELSAAFSLALEMGARLEDVALTIHAHPTLSEAFHESALAALGHPLHI
jgi:dihydrolipoamide dehydrogenase